MTRPEEKRDKSVARRDKSVARTRDKSVARPASSSTQPKEEGDEFGF